MYVYRKGGERRTGRLKKSNKILTLRGGTYSNGDP